MIYYKEIYGHLNIVSTLCILEPPIFKMDTLANSEEPDEMQHDAAFHQGLHCLVFAIIKQFLEKEMHHNQKNSTCDPLKFIMGSPLVIVLICMGKLIKIQKFNDPVNYFHPLFSHIWVQYGNSFSMACIVQLNKAK